MPEVVSIAGREVGRGRPVYILAEIGINHNGSVETARKLIDVACECGCDAVKFQKRTPELCVPPERRNLQRETPWGLMTYMEYRRLMEFDRQQYAEIDAYCRSRNIAWFASCWDEPSVDFIEQFDPPAYKVASACLTNKPLLERIRQSGKVAILSTGMSTMEQIERAVDILGDQRLILTHCTSTYPCSPEELNLKVVRTLTERFQVPVGYSGHEVGLPTTYAAVVLGACLVERHITLDRAMWGSDHMASVEPQGLRRLVRDIRVIESALGDGLKRVYESERPIAERLRGHPV